MLQKILLYNFHSNIINVWDSILLIFVSGCIEA